MRAFVVFASILLAVTVAVAEPPAPAYNYLPPAVKFNIPETSEAPLATTELITEAPATTLPPPPSAEFGANGYEYRTVRRLKYRQRVRRDVSHLNTQYLPPQKQYLPPQDNYLPPTANSKEAPKVEPEYLPPTEEVTTEAAETEAPIVVEEEVPQDTAVLTDDGYHYKQPEDMPALKEAMPSEYLPPMEEESAAAEPEMPAEEEAPMQEESAVLADDGYHYRVARRFKF